MYTIMFLSNMQVLMDKIYDIKEKVSDQEYIDLCNQVNDVRISQDEQVNNTNRRSFLESDDELSDDEEYDPYDVPEHQEAYNITEFKKKIINKKYGQYVYQYQLFDVGEYTQKKLRLLMFLLIKKIPLNYTIKAY